MFKQLFFLGFFLLTAPMVLADSKDFIALDLATGKTLRQEGDIEFQSTPASTFKIALALMGFDKGLLINTNQPTWPYRDSYNEIREETRKELDPTSWMLLSAVWYSQKLTRQLGIDAFKDYVEAFKYGNLDISGDPGENNGLTRSWLSSSLKISPKENANFVWAMLLKELPISPNAIDLTISIIPVFEGIDGWKFHGKTGTGSGKHEDGSEYQIGWFVGWAVKGDKTIVFAIRQNEDEFIKSYAGPRTRDYLIANWEELMAGKL